MTSPSLRSVHYLHEGVGKLELGRGKLCIQIPFTEPKLQPPFYGQNFLTPPQWQQIYFACLRWSEVPSRVQINVELSYLPPSLLEKITYPRV